MLKNYDSISIFFTPSFEWSKRYYSPQELHPSIERCISHYKGIYIMSNDANLAFGMIVVTFIKLSVISTFMISVFAKIRLAQSLDGFSLTFLTGAMLTALFILIPISIIMSSLYSISLHFSSNLSEQIRLVTQKKSKRILAGKLKSCSLIRVKVGNLYHMEARAKLTVLHCLAKGVVVLLVNIKP